VDPSTLKSAENETGAAVIEVAKSIFGELILSASFLRSSSATPRC
jgi:hypothetical protein